MKPTPLKSLAYSTVLSIFLAGCGGSTNDSTSSSNFSNLTASQEDSQQKAFSVSGTLTGLPSDSMLSLVNHKGEALALNANGEFRFKTPLSNGDSYAVHLLKQPEGHQCTATNAIGTVAGANVANVGVNCVAAPEVSTNVAALTVYTSTTALQSVTINNGLPYVYSGQPLKVKLVTFQPCSTGGCIFYSYTSNRTLFPVPSSYAVAEGMTESETLVTVGATAYATGASVRAGAKSVSLDVYPALGVPGSDGSYSMLGFGSSSRTGTGSVTRSDNLTMALKNLDYQIMRYATKQCLAAIPNGKLSRIGNPTINGEYKNANGLLTYDASQPLKCSL